MVVGSDAFFLGEGGLKANEVSNVFRIVRDFDGEVFAGELVVAEASAMREAQDEVFFRWGEVEAPSAGRVDVFGLSEAHMSQCRGRESVSGFETDEDGFLVLCEAYERF